MALTRRTYVAVFLILLGLAVIAGAYHRYRVDQAAADCAMPAPPEKPRTPPPNLPGLTDGTACGPGETPGAAKKTP